MNYDVDERGFYGEFGGAFIPEMMYPNLKELSDNYLKILNDKKFKNEFASLMKHYVGRPSPLFYASRLSSYHNTKIFLKREDLNHTGAHKINNTCLLYTSDAADEEDSVDLGGRRIITK